MSRSHPRTRLSSIASFRPASTVAKDLTIHSIPSLAGHAHRALRQSFHYRPLDGRARQALWVRLRRKGKRLNAREAFARAAQLQWRVAQIFVIEPRTREDVGRIREVRQ